MGDELTTRNARCLHAPNGIRTGPPTRPGCHVVNASEPDDGDTRVARVDRKPLESRPLLQALVNVNFESFKEHVCPMCKEGMPVNESFGHGKAFMAQKRKAPFDVTGGRK